MGKSNNSRRGIRDGVRKGVRKGGKRSWQQYRTDKMLEKEHAKPLRQRQKHAVNKAKDGEYNINPMNVAGKWISVSKSRYI